jgi:hypothetical protein
MRQKKKSINRYLMVSWITVILLTFTKSGFAEIGKSLEGFKNSAFMKSRGIIFGDSYEPTAEARFKAGYNYAFQSKDKKYKIELIADKQGNEISAQFLHYPLPENDWEDYKNLRLSVDFVSEASGRKIDINEFTEFMMRVKRSKEGIGYTNRLAGYLVTVAVYGLKSDLIGWNISVEK